MTGSGQETPGRPSSGSAAAAVGAKLRAVMPYWASVLAAPLVRGRLPPLRVLDLALLLDGVVEDVPQLAYVEQLDRLPAWRAIATAAILVGDGADRDAERRLRPAYVRRLLAQIEILPFWCMGVVGPGLARHPLAEHFHGQVKVEHPAEAREPCRPIHPLVILPADVINHGLRIGA